MDKQKAFDLALLATEPGPDLVRSARADGDGTRATCHGLYLHAGSSSAIFAHNAAALGLRVSFSTVVGKDDFGRMSLESTPQVRVTALMRAS